MSKIILCCGALMDYIQDAQEKCGTNYPVFELGRKLHDEPTSMREHIIDFFKTLDPEYDTVLVAMGFCGGSWQDVVVDRTVIIPRVDDCITLSMTVEEKWQPNLKEAGHIYLFGDAERGFTIRSTLDDLLKKYDETMANIVFDMYYEHYHHVDIIDNGLYDCYDIEYVERAAEDAERIHAELGYVSGSNLLLEKLVSGRWDEQFLVIPPGHNVTQETFFSKNNGL